MKRLTNILLIAASIGLIWLAGSLHNNLQDMRLEYGFTAVDPVENASPLVAFTTVALGGFRGLVADALWLRATRLQDEERYFELVQLSSWITQLEPRFGAVWAFHAWNLAYNVSVLFPEPEDRWRWVQSGVKLLRDKGIQYNPGSAELYRELGWLFQHKIGGTSDNAHWYYKQQWAEEMGELFEGPTPDFDALLEAPTTPVELLKDANVQALVEKLKIMQVDPFDDRLLTPSVLPESVQQILNDNPAAVVTLNLFLRRRMMGDIYKLNPAFMQQVDEDYGPLDWRLSQAHALYWATKGKQFATGFYAVAIDRMIFQALSEAFRRGKLFVDKDTGAFFTSPNLDVLPNVIRAYEDAIATHPDIEGAQKGYRNFLQEAIVIVDSHNQKAQAAELFEKLKKKYPDATAVENVDQYVAFSMTSFLKKRAPRQALPIIEGALYQSALWHAFGEEELAVGYSRKARVCWEHFMSTADSEEWLERMGLPPLEELEKKAVRRVQEELGLNIAPADVDKN